MNLIEQQTLLQEGGFSQKEITGWKQGKVKELQEGEFTNQEIANLLKSKGVQVSNKINKTDLIELSKANGATITTGKKRPQKNKGKNQKGTDRK